MSTKIPILSVYDENGNEIPIPAIRGKSAYQYAKDGGYTGTEAEFAERMAGVPDYVKSEAGVVADKIIAKRSANSLVLLMAADLHRIAGDTNGSTENATAIKHLGMGMAEIRRQTTPDAVVLLGDYVYNVTPLDKDRCKAEMKALVGNLYEATNGITSVWLNGNHDYYEYNEVNKVYRLTDGEQYALIGANNSKDTVVDPDNLVRNYGYVDFEKQRIRLIYLNTTDISGDVYSANYISDVQGQWLIDTALDLSDKEDEDKWGVVVCTHFPINMYSLSDAYYGTPIFSDLVAVLSSFKDKSSGTNYGVDYDFTESKAELIANFHGHIHNTKVNDVTTAGGNVIKVIAIPNGCISRENPYGGDFAVTESEAAQLTKELGTGKDTSFNAVVIDRDTETIHAICYGAGYDREISYAYKEPEVVIVNQIPISTDTNGSVYSENGIGENIRIGSDGADRTGATGKYTTGFIPITVGDKLYFKNCRIVVGTDESYNEIACYDSNKNYIKSLYLYQETTLANHSHEKDTNNCLTMIDTKGFFADTAFVRITGNYLGDDSIITKNQPIV